MGNDASTEIEIFAEGELEAELRKHGGAGEISLKKFIEKGYNDVIRTVIRPPRASYSLDNLGPVTFPLPRQLHHDPERKGNDDEEEDEDVVDPRIVRRADFDLDNDRELKLRCSHWRVFADEDATEPLPRPCLVYLHSNVGSRVDALRLRDAALARGFSVFALDFSGSGLSDGIYVTAGWNESKDLHVVLEHLDNDDDSVTAVCFYAHSMGTFPAIVNVAVRSLTPTAKTRDKLDNLPSFFRTVPANQFGKPIKGMILDGAYSKMAKITEELMASVQDEGFKVPMGLLKLACAVVQQSVKKRADVDLDMLRPIDFVDSCFIPALFVTGDKDRYVGSHHSEKLQSKYGGPAVIMPVPGDHYTARSDEVYGNALDFLYGSVRSVGMR